MGGTSYTRENMVCHAHMSENKFLFWVRYVQCLKVGPVFSLDAMPFKADHSFGHVMSSVPKQVTLSVYLFIYLQVPSELRGP